MSKEICTVDRPCQTALHKRYYQSATPLSTYKGACSSTFSLTVCSQTSRFWQFDMWGMVSQYILICISFILRKVKHISVIKTHCISLSYFGTMSEMLFKTRQYELYFIIKYRQTILKHTEK